MLKKTKAPKKAQLLSKERIPSRSPKFGTTASSPPATTPIPILHWVVSLLLLVLAAFLVPGATTRMARLWMGQDGFERYPLNFTLNGVPAEWGYAAWTGPLTDDIKQKFKHPEELALNGTYTLPPKANQNVDGGPLVINGSAFETGIGTHAPSKIAFSLQGKFGRFSCLVGLDKTAVNSQGVIYTVIADGREIFRSPKLKLDADPFPIDISVAGVKELVLDAIQTEFTNTGSNVDWVNLKFEN